MWFQLSPYLYPSLAPQTLSSRRSDNCELKKNPSYNLPFIHPNPVMVTGFHHAVAHYTGHNCGKGRSLFTFVTYLSVGSLLNNSPKLVVLFYISRSIHLRPFSISTRLCSTLYIIYYLLAYPFSRSYFATFHRSMDIHTSRYTQRIPCADCIGNFVSNENVTHQNIDGRTLANLKAKYYINRATIKIII